MKKNYFDVCPRCGAHLDPGETCDCEEDKRTSITFSKHELTQLKGAIWGKIADLTRHIDIFSENKDIENQLFLNTLKGQAQDYKQLLEKVRGV